MCLSGEAADACDAASAIRHDSEYSTAAPFHSMPKHISLLARMAAYVSTCSGSHPYSLAELATLRGQGYEYKSCFLLLNL